MIILVAGDTHGQLNQFYDLITNYENSLGIKIDFILQVGDFGIWPDPEKADKATLRHGVGDFPDWFKNSTKAPYGTYFIKGNHEDFNWLKQEWLLDQPTLGKMNLTYIKSGWTWLNTFTQTELNLGAVGGCKSDISYMKHTPKQQHYGKSDVDFVLTMTEHKTLNIVLTHDSPISFVGKGGRGEYTHLPLGLDQLIPHAKRMWFGHHHRFIQDAQFPTVMGLNEIPYGGSMCVYDSELDTILDVFRAV